MNPAPPTPNNAPHTETLLAASEATRLSGDHESGAALAEQALVQAQAAGTAAEAARAQALVALHRMRLGQPEAAIRAGLQALEHFTAAGDARQESELHCTLTLAYQQAALLQQALQHVIAALESARRSTNRRALCWAMLRASMVHGEMGDTSRGLDFAQQGLLMARALDAGEETFAAMNALVNACIAHGVQQQKKNQDATEMFDAAVHHAEQAVELAATQGNTHRETTARGNLGHALALLGRHCEAQQQFVRTKELALAHGYIGLARESEFELALISENIGGLDRAAALLDTLLQHMPEGEDLAHALGAHRALHRIHKRLGRFESALAHHEKLLTLSLQEQEQLASLQSRLMINQLEVDQARYQVERAQLEAEMHRMRAEELDRAAHHDPLTGLANRRFIDRQLPRLIARAQSRGLPLSATLLDIDHFKTVNDQFGHAMGDRVLAELAALLRKSTRGSDIGARIGGEEFLLVFVDTALETANEVCERLRASVQAHNWNTFATGMAPTISLGLAALGEGESLTAWMARTDAAMYAAKHAGRNRVVVAQVTSGPE